MPDEVELEVPAIDTPPGDVVVESEPFKLRAGINASVGADGQVRPV